MKTIAVIPARGGSTRIPRKNIKEFHGKPIIAYSIEKAKNSQLFDIVIVSTDDDEIASVAMKYGADVWRRDPKYGENDVGTQAVMAECLIGMGFYSPQCCACCIYATSPLMSIHDLTRGYDVLRGEPVTSFVLSVGYPPLCDAGQFYWGSAYDFRMNIPLINPQTRMVRIAPNRLCDINTPEDWIRAEKMYEAL